MKKIITILILIISFLHSNEILSNNITVETYNKIKTKIINNPYEQQKSNIKNNELEINRLNQKIIINSKRNNTYAVIRDKLKIDNLIIQNKSDKLLNTLSMSVINKDIESLNKLLDEISNTITKIKDKYSEYEKVNIITNNNVIQEGKENYILLKENIHKLSEFIYILKSDVNSFIINNFFLKHLNIINIRNIIDHNTQVQSINSTFELENYTIGNIVLSLGFFLLILLLIPIIIKLLKLYLNKKGYSRIINKIKYIYAFLFLYNIYIFSLIFFYPNELNVTYNNILISLFILIITLFIHSLSKEFFIYKIEQYENMSKEIRTEIVNIIIKFTNVFIFLIGLLFILNQFSINLTYIVSTLGFGGLAVALAAKDTLSNLFSGISILFDNSYSQGDWISTSSVEGNVIELRLRSTTIRTFDNALVTIPNNELANTAIKNWHKRKIGRRIKLKVRLTYDSDLDKISKVIIDIRKMLLNHKQISNQKTEFLDKTRRMKIISKEDEKGVKRTLFVHLVNLSEFSIDIEVYCFTKTVSWDDWREIQQDVIFKIMKIVKDNELEFAFPTQTLHLSKN